MKKEEIYKVFQHLGISEEMLPTYSDPYTFAEEIKKFSLLELDEVTYSTGTGSVKEEKDAKLE